MVQRQPRSPGPEPIPFDRWLEPGSRAFATFFPELHWRYSTRTMRDHDVRRLMDRQLRGLVRCVCRKHRRDDRETVKDLVQELKIRVARMDAASKYDPSMGTPLDFLSGIADKLGMERFVRRQPPRMACLDRAPEPCVRNDPIERFMNRVDRIRWRLALRELTPGERRALAHEFGPLPGTPVPTRRPRRPNNPVVLRHAAELLRQARLHEPRQ